MIDFATYIQQNHFMTYNGIKPVKAENGYAETEAELTESGLNLSGYAHGGLLATMADCTAGLAARTDGRRYVTQNMNIHYISNIQQGRLRARGEVISRKRTVTVVHVSVCDESGKLLADAVLSMFCIDPPSAPRK